MGRLVSAILVIGIIGGFMWYVKKLASDVQMPTTRDKKLIGHWFGKKTEKPSPRFKDIQLLSNGTAIVPGMSQIRWGTADGVLHLVGRAAGTDWISGVYPYKFGTKNRSLKFNVQPLTMLPIEWVRH